LLSLVVPVFNEAEVLPTFHARLSAVLEKIPFESEIIYIDDGSRDASSMVLQALRSTDSRVGIISFSRNFGKETAMTAGLDHTRGDIVVVIDADLQDPPELIPTLVQGWRQGYDVVYGRRTTRHGETRLKRASSAMFYRVIHRMSGVQIPKDTGDFRLLSRRAVESLRQLREQHRFMKGLFAWIGYPALAVDYERDARVAGRSKWNYWRLWNFALEGITSFSTAPLKVATYVGALVSLLAFVFAGVVIVKTVLYGDPVRGFPSLMVAILLLGGIQLVSVGLIGEYLARVFDEVKGRPLYLLKHHAPPISAGQQARLESREVSAR
jgi:glycosyltransferase involved in cell wall biosynthesis